MPFGGRFQIGVSVSHSVKLIVDAFVSLKDRESLDEMREHRQRLRDQLQARVGQAFDVGQTVKLVDEDLRVIDDGVARLQA
jgi:hypothetical protein